MSHARVEELSDSDPDIDDPSDFLPDTDQSIIQRTDIPSLVDSHSHSHGPDPTSFQPPPQGQYLRPMPPSSKPIIAQKEEVKAWQTLYPVYFDSSRTRSEGRRVSSQLAIPDPLARNILEAVSSATAGTTLRIAFEPDKLHPKDWANPGRVRIQLRDQTTGQNLHPPIKNKSHLYILVARYLQAHPTTKDDPFKMKIQGMPIPEKLEAPAVPRGWKINQVLPLHSPAMSGGGVSDNFFKDMMAEMQKDGGPQLPAAMANAMNDAGARGEAGGGGGAKKKEKKRVKA